MAAAVVVFRDQMIRADHLAADQKTERQRADAEKRTALAGMAGTIEVETGSALDHIGQRTTCTAMIETATEMATSAGRTRSIPLKARRSRRRKPLANAQAVAGAGEQLTEL